MKTKIQIRRITSWVTRLAEFSAVQLIVQLIGVGTGFISLHLMSKQQFAHYAIVLQTLSVCNLLADLGIGIGVKSIGSRVYNSQQQLGSLVNSALELRFRYAIPAISICLPTMIWLLRANHTEWSSVVYLCIIVLVSLIPALAVSVLLFVPQIHGEFRRIQNCDLFAAMIRLGVIASSGFFTLSAELAAIAGLLANWGQLYAVKTWSSVHANLSAPASREFTIELASISRRCLPNAIFLVFSGQITIITCTVFSSTNTLADIVAVGRLGVLLSVLSSITTTIVAPSFSKVKTRRSALYMYGAMVCSVALLFLMLLLLFTLFPKLITLILGPQYESGTDIVALALGVAAIGQVNSTVWALNSSKGWVWWIAYFNIPVSLSVMIAAAITFDLTGAVGILLMNFCIAFCQLFLYLVDAHIGVRRSF